MKGFRARISAEEAAKSILDRFRTSTPPEHVVREIPVEAASGFVLARRLGAPQDVPRFDRAAMDGWAVRGEDTFGASAYSPLDLSVSGELLAGDSPSDPLGKGQAIRIMTGAPLPEGANAVLPAELGREEQGTLKVVAAVPPERHVSRRGEDVRAGSTLLEAGRRLRPQDIACAAATGITETPVYLPRVAILMTGDELIPVGAEEPLDAGQVFDVNSVLLEPLVERDGGEIAEILYAPDERDALSDALLHAASNADIVLVSGGSSVGARDFVPELVQEHGELLFHGVAMRPSSPSGFGVLSGSPVFLLPGNPVSCFCAYDFFAGPLVRSWAGRSPASPYPVVERVLARKIVSELGRMDYVRVRETDAGLIEPVATSGASILSSTVHATGFVVVPETLEGFQEGDRVSVSLYDPAEGQPS